MTRLEAPLLLTVTATFCVTSALPAADQAFNYAELKALFFREGKRQVDYALGANPYGRSYLVGFGNQPFNHVQHRGAYGSWVGFEHFIPGKADDRGTCRHVLYGALVAALDHNDVSCAVGIVSHWLPLPDGKGHDIFYEFPNREAPVPKGSYVWNVTDAPVPNVMDSQFNEVALDYNAGFTASLAYLTATELSSGRALPGMVKLRVTAPNWQKAKDWSADSQTEQSLLLPRLPVYDRRLLAGGSEPAANSTAASPVGAERPR